MAIPAVAKGHPVRFAHHRLALAHRWTDPRTVLGFAFLLTIGIAGTSLVIGLLSPGAEARAMVAGIGSLTIAACWAIALVVAWFALLCRCLVTLGEAMLGPPARSSSRKKSPSRSGPAALADHWLDGPS